MNPYLRYAVILVVAAVGSFGYGSAAGAEEHAYVGNKKCKICHLKEWKSWSETKMAKAFDLLKPGERADAKKTAGLDPGKDYTKDTTCLPCHATGYGEEGGFVDIETTPKHSGVGCEMCHGAGGTYIQAQYMSLKNKEYQKDDIVKVGMVGEITMEQCVTCHNTESPFVGDNYVFDFEMNKEKGTHQKFPLKYKH